MNHDAFRQLKFCTLKDHEYAVFQNVYVMLGQTLNYFV
jgi:hypothetical protein